ncbi:MAG: ABC transporter permease [Bacteroidetes bacterium]|nr:ABC transporter permease [Bacteroidota bacterium]
MLKFISKRLAYGVIVLIGVVSVVFSLFNFLPVDPARLTLGQRADVESVEAIRKELGLDKPKWQQYLMYLNDVSPLAIHEKSPEAKAKYKYATIIPFAKRSLVLKRPYLRRSYQTKREVSEILLTALPKTAILAVSAIIIACFFGITLGMLAAVRQYSLFDNVAMSLSVFGISVPSYLSAMVLGYLFGILWHDWTGLNHVGDLTAFDDYGNEYLEFKNLILPAIALGIRPIGIIFQLTRSAMLDVLSQDYIRTARAKGLSFFKVLYKHALRNAMNPVLTTVSGWFASLLAGAYFVELIFDIKGLGFVTVINLLQFDFPVAMGAVLFTATIFVVVNILVDILYGILDPRVSVGK